MDFVANFQLNTNDLEANFELNQPVEFDALFTINPTGATWGSITGTLSNQEDLQNALDDLSGDISTLNTNIQNEAATRAENDSLLRGDINTLNNNLTNEINNRTTADNGLQTQINSVKQTADSALQPNDNISELVNDVGYITSASLPTVNDATITIQKNGITVESFTLNQSNNETINITVPTQTSDITNDSGFITNADLPTLEDLTTTEQLNAINSGATASKIGQIATNTSNINSLSDTVTNNYNTLDGRITSEVLALNTSIGAETTNRQNADNNLQSQIDAITSASDVFDIVGTYAELQAYDISTVPVNDIIKVLVDSTHNNSATYYRCTETGNVKSWSYIGFEGAYYTKSEADSLFVEQTTTVNGKPLSNNITLTASDVGALPSSTVIGSGVLTIQVNGSDIDTFNANATSNKSINITVPTKTSDLTNDSDFATVSQIPTNNNQLTNGAGYITSADLPTNYVTTDTVQNITAEKTFVGNKLLKFKGANSSSKLGFTAFDSSNREVGYLEAQGQGNASHKCRLGIYDTNTSTYDNALGFEYYKAKGSDGALHRYNLLCPPLYPSTTAQDFYIPMSITDGTNTITATNTGTVDISSLLPDVSNFVTTSTLTTTLADYQPLLVSGTSIKTINNESILGSGNIDIQGGVPTIIGITPIEVSDAPPTYAPSEYISYSDGVISANWSGLTSPHQGDDFYIDIVIPEDININALNDYWYIGNKDNAQQLGFRYYDISQYYENYIFYELFDDNNNKVSRLWYGSQDFRAGNDISVPTMSTDGSIDGAYVFGIYHNAGETASYLINSSESTDNNVSSGLTITNSRLSKIRLYYSPRQLGNGFATDNNNIWACICDKSQIGGYGSLQETAILNSLKLYTSPTDTTGIELIREGTTDGYSIKLNIGEGLAVDNNNLISLAYTQSETDSLLNDKQDVLTEGDGISISGGVTTLPNNFTGDSPLITCDSTESGYPAYYAFDGDNSTYWGGVNTGEHWITRQHNSIIVKSVSVSFREYSERFTQGEIQGSNDGTTFTTIASFSNNENTSIIIDCSSNTTAYTYTRLVGTTTDSGWGKVGEMVISYETPSVISVNSTIARTSQIPTVDQTYDGTSTNAQSGVAIEGELTTNYQSKLVSGTNIKTVNNTSLLGNGNIDTSEVFVAEFNITSYADVQTAYNAGKTIYCLYTDTSNNKYIMWLNYVTQTYFDFYSSKNGDLYITRCNSTGNTWELGYFNLEVVSNKVTSISSSSTDTQYPSAKCVYDELTNKADTDLSNVPTSKGILTESYVNGTSGYRVYADNYCVQWGRFTGKSGTITLLKSYADTNYSVAYSSAARISWFCIPSTVNTMIVASDSSNSYDCYWITTGFIGG